MICPECKKEFTRQDDDLNPARGIVIGLVIGIIFWMAIIIIIL